MTDLTQLLEQYESLSPMKKAEIDKLVREDILDKPWRPLINIDTPEIITPQQQAFDSKADILLFGGWWRKVIVIDRVSINIPFTNCYL